MIDIQSRISPINGYKAIYKCYHLALNQDLVLHTIFLLLSSHPLLLLLLVIVVVYTHQCQMLAGKLWRNIGLLTAGVCTKAHLNAGCTMPVGTGGGGGILMVK